MPRRNPSRPTPARLTSSSGTARSHRDRSPSHRFTVSPSHLLEPLESRQLLATISWDGGPTGLGTNWHDAANWAGDVLPGANDEAVLNVTANPTITITQNVTVNSVTSDEAIQFSSGTLSIAAASQFNAAFGISGGTLTGTGELTITGTLNWTGGTMAGTGTTHIAAVTGVLSIGGTATHNLNRMLENDGAATWTGSGPLAMNGGRFTNDGSFTANSSSTLDGYGTGGTNAFINNGTFTKLGTGTARFRIASTGLPLTNAATGTLTVQAGVLELTAGGSSNGTLAAEPGATLRFMNSYTHQPGSLLNGAGTVEFTGGTHSFPAATFAPTGTVNFTSGTITINNAFTPTTLGTIGATATLNSDVDYTGAVTVSGTVSFNATQNFSSLVLSGTLMGAGEITIGSLSWTGGIMRGTGRTILTGSGTITAGPHWLARILEDRGTLTKNTPAILNMGYFSGVYEYGTLVIAPSAEFTAAGAGVIAELGFPPPGTGVRNSGMFRKTGTGLFRLDSGQQMRIVNEATGMVRVEEGTLQWERGINSGAIEVRPGATVRLTTATGAAEVFEHQPTSLLSGAGTVEFTGSTHVFPSGTFMPTGQVNFSNLSPTIFSTATINNEFTPQALGTISGTVTFNAAVSYTGAVAITRMATFAATQSFSDLTLSGTLTGSGDITVTGTLSWTGGTMSGAGTTVIAAATGMLSLTNNAHLLQRALRIDGAANWSSGDINFQSGAVLTNNGNFAASTNGTLTCQAQGGSASRFDNNGTFTKQGTGTVVFSIDSGALPFNGNGAVNIQQGTLRLQSGGGSTAAIDVSAGATLQFASSYAPPVTGTAIRGAGTVLFTSGTQVFNSALVSTGTVNFTGGTQTFAPGQFQASGAVAITAGTITFNNDLTPASFTGTGIATVTFNGHLGHTGPITISGGGRVSFSQSQTFSAMTLNGVREGPGQVTVTGLFSGGGNMHGPGRTVLMGPSTVVFFQLRFGHVLENNGTMVRTGPSGGGWWLFDGSTVINRGSITQTNSGGLNEFDFSQGYGLFDNYGSFIKAGDGFAIFAEIQGENSGAQFINRSTGTVSVQGGQLWLGASMPATHDGSFDIAPGAALWLVGGDQFGAAARLSGAGRFGFGHSFVPSPSIDGPMSILGPVVLDASGITFGGSFSANTLTISGGTFNFNTPTAAVVGGVSLSGGTLSGSSDLVVTGNLIWTGGTMTGPGRTIVGADGMLTLSGGTHNLQRVLENNGTATWTGGALAMNAGMILNNGSFTVDTTSTLDAFASGGVNAFTNSGTLAKLGAGTARFQGIATGVAFTNAVSGTVIIQSGVVELAGGGSNSGVMRVQAGTLDLGSSFLLAGPGILASEPSASTVVRGNLLGETQSASLFSPRGITQFVGPASQLLEVMSRDLGPLSAGFADNFAFGFISLSGGTTVTLVDDSDNVAASVEALYMDTLLVPAGTTLNLNGKRIYARAVNAEGTINEQGGSIQVLTDSGPLLFGTPVSGVIDQGDSDDEWTFFGIAGRSLAVVLNPGGGPPPQPLPPPLTWVAVEVFTPDNGALAAADNVISGAGSPVSIVGLQLPATGTYRLRVRAPTAQPGAMGRYILTVYDATVDVLPLTLNERQAGVIETAFAIDRWTFTAAAEQQVRFDFVNASTPGIAFTLTGPSGFAAFSDIASDSGFINLPVSGLYMLTARMLGTGVASGSYAFRLEQTGVSDLVPGVVYSGDILGTAQAQLFRFLLPRASSLHVEMDDASSTDRNELYLRQGSPPTRSLYDYRYVGAATSDPQVLVPSAQQGDWYVLVYTTYAPLESTFSLSALALDIRLTAVTPDHSSAQDGVVTTLTGAGFIPGTTVILIDPDNMMNTVTGVVEVDSFSRITATFDLTGRPQVAYDVRVTRPGLGDNDTLPGAFSITAQGFGRLETRLIMPGSLGRHALATIYVEYANVGTAAMPSPLLVLHSGDDDGNERPILTLDQSLLTQGFWTRTLPDGFSHSIQILASGATPGVLAPGERLRVPVYYAGLLRPWFFSDTRVEMRVSVIQSPHEPFNWSGITRVSLQRANWDPYEHRFETPGHPFWASMPWTTDGIPPSPEDVAARWPAPVEGPNHSFGFFILNRIDEPGILQQPPQGMAPDAWPSVVSNLRASVGESVGEFAGMLADNAQFLGRLGQRVADIGELWSFEVQQALGLNPIRTLSTSLDAAISTPGDDLSFGRFYALPLDQRFETSAFGRGWDAPWLTRLDIERRDPQDPGSPIETVTVIGAGGSGRRFQADSRSTSAFFASAGDTGTLRLVSGDPATLQLREQDGSTVAFDTAGVLLWSRDSNNNTVTLGYDGGAGGRLSTLTHSSGASLAIAYNAAGLISDITDSAGRTTTYAYDPTNQYLLSVTGPDGQVTAYTYDAAPGSPRQHALTSITSGGTTRSFQYDGRGRLAATFQTGGAGRIDFAYDSAGRVTATDAAGGATGFSYDHRGLLGRIVDPFGNITTAEYGADQRLARLVDPIGQSQQFSWDRFGGLTGTTNELGFTTTFAYTDTPGGRRLASFTDARGQTTRYAYDARGNLVSTTYPNQSVERIGGYDPAGNPLSFINRRGQSLSYQYNAAGQVSRQTFQDGSLIDFAYDARGNLTTVTEPGNRVTDFDYDAGDRLTRVEYPTGRYLEFQYDQFGRRTGMTDQDGFVVNYEYDAAGRLLRLTDGVNVLFVEYTYDAAGRLSRKDNGNGTYTLYTYDAAGQLLSIFNHAPGGGVNSSFVYTYDDALGRRTSMATIDGTWTYEYDATGQLTDADFAPGPGSPIPIQDLHYEYDAVGNRIRSIENGVTAEYMTNNLNQYARLDRAPFNDPAGDDTFVYDADGNLVSRSGPGGNATYTYDQQGRLTRVVTPEGTWQYDYDAFGNRIASTLNGQRTEFLLDPTGIVDVVGEYASAGALVARYVHGIGLVARHDAQAGLSSFYDFDGIGSTSTLTDSMGQVANRYAYTPFGESRLSSGPAPNPFQYIGQFGVMREGNGLQFIRARYASTTTGSFVASDPLGILGGFNTYRYALNNPVSVIDTTGAIPLIVVGAGAGAVAGAVEWAFSGDYSWGTFAGTVGGGLATGALIGATGGLGLLGRVSWGVTQGAGSYAVSQWIDGEGIDGGKLFLAGLTGGVFGAFGGTYQGNWSARLPKLSTVLSGGSLRANFIYRDLVPDFLESLIGNLLDADPLNDGESGVSTATDPNHLLGPSGFGPQNFVSIDAALPYRIEFENYGPGSLNEDGTPVSPDRWATAPAQQVVITSTLNPNLDASSFRFTGFGFGDFNISLDVPAQHHQQVLSMAYNGRTFEVWFEADLDLATRALRATFQSIDPATSLPPDVLTGFLPPEDSTGRGKGFVTYTVLPMAALPTGTEIRSIALISFDSQTFIATNQVDPLHPEMGTDPTKEALVTIDSGLPSSTVAALPASSTSGRIPVSWSGSDDPGGSGVGTYDIYVSINGADFVPWLIRTTLTSAIYNAAAAPGSTYAFYSIAYDNTGNAEPPPSPPTADTSTTFGSPTAIYFDNDAGDFDLDNPINWSADTLPAATDDVLISLGAGDQAYAPVTLATGSLTFATLIIDHPLIFTGGSLTITGPAYMNADVSIDSGSLSLAAASTLTGTLANAGTLSLASTAALAITGDYLQTAAGTLHTDIASTSTYGRITATGAATLDGAISATFVHGYTQTRNDTFDFITASSLTGAFATRNLPDPNSANTLKPITLYTPTSARLFITSTADWNSDGILNSQDFFDFLAILFTDPIDFNHDGVNNSQDFFDYLGVFFMG